MTQWTNVYVGGRQLATYDSAGTHFALTDWLGTKRVELNVTGVSTVGIGEQCQSLPFGDGLACTGTDVNQLHFTGKQHDTESGNDYFLARYYASGMAARFLTPDWSKNPQGVPYANYADPQSLDLYSYMRDNPLSGVDADGHLELGAAPPCKVMHGTTCANAQDATNFKKKNAKWLAGQRKLNAAAMKAETAAIKLTRGSIRGGNAAEYGGYIIKANGKIGFTKPIRGGNIDFDHAKVHVPKGATIVGVYHTHPESSALEGEGPSVRDINYLRDPNRASWVGYVAGSYSGNVYRYTEGEPVKGPFDTAIYGTKIGVVPCPVSNGGTCH